MTGRLRLRCATPWPARRVTTFDVTTFSHAEVEIGVLNDRPTFMSVIGLCTVAENELGIVVDHVKASSAGWTT